MLAATVATFALALAPGHAADNYCDALTVQRIRPSASLTAVQTYKPRWNKDHDRVLYGRVAQWDGIRITNNSNVTLYVECTEAGTWR